MGCPVEEDKDLLHSCGPIILCSLEPLNNHYHNTNTNSPVAPCQSKNISLTKSQFNEICVTFNFRIALFLEALQERTLNMVCEGKGENGGQIYETGI